MKTTQGEMFHVKLGPHGALSAEQGVRDSNASLRPVRHNLPPPPTHTHIQLESNNSAETLVMDDEDKI